MRRAFAWLLPGQGPGGTLHLYSPCASPGWLLKAVGALSTSAAQVRTCANAATAGDNPSTITLPDTGRVLATDADTHLPSVDMLHDNPDTYPTAMVCSSNRVTEGPTLSTSISVDSSTHDAQLAYLSESPKPSPLSCSPSWTSFAASSPTPSSGVQLTQTSISPTASSQSVPTPPLPDSDVAALIGNDSSDIVFTASEASVFLMLVQQVANSYEFFHTATGLPWAASIPLTTLALRLMLLPLSMRQARIIRSNFSLYREALALTDQQERERQQQLQVEQQQQQQQLQFQHGRGQGPQHHASDGTDVFGATNLKQELQDAGQIKQQQKQQQQQQQQQEQKRKQQQHSAFDSPGGAEAAATSAPAVPSSAGADLPSVLQARLHRSHSVLVNFEMLRCKVDAPHPAWIVVNPLVQIPVFVLVSTTLGIMCRLPWPGLAIEGALWFPDLTLPAVVMETGEMPLGPQGLILPLLVYGMTMTSLRLGFGASGLAGKQLLQSSGAAPTAGIQDTTLAAFLRSLAPLLYVLTTLNLYFKVQMAHGILMHWLGSAGFTLSLQLALRNPALRALLKLNKLPSAAASSSLTAPRPERSSDPAPSATSSPSSALSAAAASPYPDSGASTHPLAAPLPSDLVARVEVTSDPNVLVIMGAQLSARHHYAGSLHCLRKAVLLSPSHVRAHYSMGQVFSLTGCWPDAETSYRAAAALAAAGPERGQALYCVATALHAQGEFEAAAAAYAEADINWPGQTVIAYGRANALAAAGRAEEALAALAEAEARDEATAGRPFRSALARLRAGLATATTTVAEGGDEDGRTTRVDSTL